MNISVSPCKFFVAIFLLTVVFKFNWMQRNYVLYGYPFVGKKWVPHFTVASLNKKTNKKKFLEKFLNNKIFLKDSIEKISFYEIKKEKHIYLWSIKVNNNA